MYKDFETSSVRRRITVDDEPCFNHKLLLPAALRQYMQAIINRTSNNTARRFQCLKYCPEVLDLCVLMDSDLCVWPRYLLVVKMPICGNKFVTKCHYRGKDCTVMFSRRWCNKVGYLHGTGGRGWCRARVHSWGTMCIFLSQENHCYNRSFATQVTVIYFFCDSSSHIYTAAVDYHSR